MRKPQGYVAGGVDVSEHSHRDHSCDHRKSFARQIKKKERKTIQKETRAELLV